MIPKKLTLEGFYAYQQKQVIDFEKLTEANLFGIFGPVGSGKSALLEAISLGLYGSMERLGGLDKLSYNIMNLKSDSTLIDFEFYNHQQKLYRVIRSYKRNKNHFDRINTITPIFYEWINEQWTPTTESVENIIGLNYSNFKKTVIIPQGKFKEFIELTAGNRTKMLKEIFKLEKFDLFEKASILNKKNNEQLNLIEGQLISLEAVTEPEIISKTNELNLVKEQTSQNQKVLKELENKYNLYHNLKDDHNNLVKLNSRLLELKQQENDLKIRESKTAQYELLHTVFSLRIEQREKLNQSLSTLTQKIIIAQKEHHAIIQEFKILEQEKAEVQTAFDKIEENKVCIADARNWANIHQHQILLKEKSLKLESGEGFLEDQKRKLVEGDYQINNKELEISAKKTNLIPPQVLIEISSWMQEKNNISKIIQKLKTELNNIQQEIQTLQTNYPEKHFKELNKEIIQIEKDIEEENQQLQQLLVKNKLSEYAQSLQDNHPCPLCGSLHHPAVEHNNTTNELVNISEENIKKLKTKNENIQLKLRSHQQVKDKIKWLEIQSEKLFQELGKTHKQEEQHQQSFNWEGFNPEDQEGFNRTKQQQNELNSIIQQMEEQLKNFRRNQEKEFALIEKAKAKIQIIANEKIKLEAELNTFRNNIVNKHDLQWISSDAENIHKSIKTIEDTINQVNNHWRKINHDFEQIVQNQVKSATSLKHFQQEHEQLLRDKQELNTIINSLLEKHDVNDIATVQLVLQQNIDIDKEKLYIKQYHEQLTIVTAEVNMLKNKLQGQEFEESIFGEIKDALTHSKALQQKYLEKSGELSNELNRLLEQFAIKQKLTEQCNHLNKRKVNLNTLMNLFKASGFVDYISSIYLNNLCQMANVRFHKMTKNALSLTINDQNDFEVIDYMHEGKTRSVKTLSGGQSFQVALSLALALAENVQSLSQSHKNFFFIDEGFGTQDAESLDLVFETLTELNKENRIVGIISHVDELKERMARSITISKSEQNGSKIHYNY